MRRLRFAYSCVLGLLAMLADHRAAAESTRGAPQVITLNEREPISLVLVTPSGVIANGTSSGVYRIVGDVLSEHTNLRAELYEGDLSGECRSSVGCFVLRVRSDFDASARKFRDKAPPHAKYLVILSIRSAEDTDTISALLVDTDEALAHYAPIAEEFETAIFARALRVRTVPVAVKSEIALEKTLTRFLLEDFRSALEASKNWEPYGEISVATPFAGATIQLDGVVVGSTVEGKTRIVRVPRGDHTLVLAHPLRIARTLAVHVEPGHAAEVDGSLAERPKQGSGTADAITFWSGAGMAGVGAALVALAIYRGATESAGTVCFAAGAAPSSSCSGGGYVRFGDKGAGAVASVVASPSGSGPPIFPLGLGALVAGGAWLGGSLIGDADLPGWVTMIAGALAGALAFGATILLEPAHVRAQ